jgi:hypothetical protein
MRFHQVQSLTVAFAAGFKVTVSDGPLTLWHAFGREEDAEAYRQAVTEGLRPAWARLTTPTPYRGVTWVKGSDTEFEFRRAGRTWRVTGDNGLPHVSRSLRIALQAALRDTRPPRRGDGSPILEESA